MIMELELLDVVGEMCKRLKPDIYAVNSDAFDIPKRKRIMNELGIRIEILERTCPAEFENISTTKVIEKIKTLD